MTVALGKGGEYMTEVVLRKPEKRKNKPMSRGNMKEAGRHSVHTR